MLLSYDHYITIDRIHECGVFDTSDTVYVEDTVKNIGFVTMVCVCVRAPTYTLESLQLNAKSGFFTTVGL